MFTNAEIVKGALVLAAVVAVIYMCAGIFKDTAQASASMAQQAQALSAMAQQIK
ncbi:hypothetical protein [Caballeronia sp. BCC1704]|uniref:hypothetical protein n=1 Tax=Caballeronia sp. BCC1704 TaxID=2676300 RepID=UPI00158B9D93|nr:hypothetical protein [Caballeronia sp. BCC1704]